MDGGVMDAGADAEGGMVDTGVALDSGIDSAPADADTGAAVVDPTMLGPFGTPTRVSWTTNNDDDPSFTADLRELFFNRPGPGGMNDIWLSTRSGPAVPWGPPVHVPELSDSAAEESAPRVTRDGLSFFVSRAVAGRGFDILVANRSSRTAPWSPLAPVADLNSTQDERCVALYGGGTGVILHSNRPSGGVDDLFEFRRPTPAAPWGPGVALDELNTVVDDAQPWVTIDGLHVYFTTARDGGRDIYSASRPDLGTPFGAITSVTDLNNPDRDSDLVMSDDGRYVIFESRRGGAGGLWEASR